VRTDALEPLAYLAAAVHDEMNAPLIRPAALLEMRYLRYGRTRLRMRLSHLGATGAIGVLVAALVYLAATTTYTERSTVTGYLVPDAGIARVRAARNGIVDAIRVAQGDRVARGAALVELRSDTALESLENHAAAVAANLDRHAAELSSRRDSVRRRAEAERERLDLERAGLERERTIIAAQIDAEQRWLATANDRSARVRAASAAGAVPLAEALRQQNEAVAGEIDLKNLERQRAVLERSLAEVAQRVEAANAERDAEQATIALAELDLASAALENDRTRAEVVVAPIAGRVVSITVDVGANVAAGRELVVVAPERASLGAALFVPPRAIGLIREGEPVALRYDAFPYQEFGIFRGYVAAIGDFVFDRRDVDVELPISGPVFRVFARLERQSLEAHGREVDLKPGMTLVADVATRELTVFEWLIEPLRALRGAPFDRRSREDAIARADAHARAAPARKS
jgi:membrane fusion protein